MRSFLFLMCLTCTLSTVTSIRADVLTFSIGSSSFNVVNGTPTTFTSTAQPAVNNALGYSLSANWTDGGGEAWSRELRLAMTGPGGVVSVAQPVGGLANNAAYTFPTGSNANTGATFTLLGSGPLPNYAAGSYQADFTTIFAGTTATLGTASITVYSNPTNIAGSTVTGLTFNRPAISAFDDIGASAVQYTTTTFTVDSNGRYMIAEGYDTAYDGAFYLYNGAFDPLNPTVNLIGAADNPSFSNGPSTLTAQLSVGTLYTVVSTGFTATDAGSFTLYGAGPGTVSFTPIPEPMSILGVVTLAGIWFRRRQRGV
ncbi:MAG: PEP-CTERM sorting domain-containing protein [Gemmataceae bacterium]